jgi:hypothetical protein
VELECEVLLLEQRPGAADMAAAAAARGEDEELPDASSSEGTDGEQEDTAATDASSNTVLQVNRSRLCTGSAPCVSYTWLTRDKAASQPAHCVATS